MMEAKDVTKHYPQGIRMVKALQGVSLRIEAGELHLRRRWGAVDEIISTALARAEPQTKDRKVEVDIEPELPVVRVDERAVSEVVYTLVDNASKYSPDGTIIRISARRSQDGMIVMSVEVVERFSSPIPVV